MVSSSRYNLLRYPRSFDQSICRCEPRITEEHNMSRRTVRFAPNTTLTPRGPKDEELYTIRCFSQHVRDCQLCSVTETETTYRCKFCRRGKNYGIDMLPYLAYEHGRCFSVIDDRKGLGRTEVIIPNQYRESEVFLRCQAPSRARPSCEPRWRTVATPPVTLVPEISRAQTGTRPGELFMHVTIPTFSIPIRIRQDNH